MLLLFFTNVQAQQKVKGRELTRPEIMWSLAHPLAALKAKKCAEQVRCVVDSLERNKILTGSSGGQLDAFRHAYWMALMSMEMKPSKARKLGKAHEKGNYLQFTKGKLEDHARPDSLSCEMDLKNNEAGISIGTRLKTEKQCSRQQIINTILEEIRKGNLYVLKTNQQGQFLTCSGEVIDVKQYRDKWFIPKCLCKSNETN
ncbi:MAG: hypothetical protein Fur0041_19460 [Bacteroidia bacterium]